MKIKQNKRIDNKKIILLISCSIFLFIVISIKNNFGFNNIKNIKPIKQTYHSQLLKFTISIPEGYTILDLGTEINLKNKQGLISITRNGTNFLNLEDYLNWFQTTRKTRIISQKQLTINNFSSEERIFELSNINKVQKSFFVFVNSSIFIFSTSSKELYGDLDEIAKSFKYIP